MTPSNEPSGNEPLEQAPRTDAETPPASAPADATPTPTVPTDAAPRRRWSTPAIAVAAATALVVGVGAGGIGGWAIAHGDRPGPGFAQADDGEHRLPGPPDAHRPAPRDPGLAPRHDDHSDGDDDADGDDPSS